MLSPSLTRRSPLVCWWRALPVFGLLLILNALSVAQVQEPGKDDPQRHEALELFDQGKMVDAMPLLEALSAKYPSDIVVRERWAFATLLYAGTIVDPELRKKARIRARKIALEAQKLGDNSPLLQTALEVPEDGSEPVFSNRKEVDEAMKAAEADFARGDYDKARNGYIRAMLLEPNNYEAALFTGDVYFKQHVQGSAGEWFARAVQINPDRETAYRYWGDALMALGKNEEARVKFIEAIVAEPYNRSPWQGAQKWAHENKAELHLLKLQDKSQVTVKDEGHINLTLDDSTLKKKGDPNGVAWMVYGMSRAGWRGDRFKKEFPNEPQYRHTMKEEADSLDLMVKVLKEQKDYAKKMKELDPGLLEVIQIDEARLLEPYVLLNRADTEISRDYPAYRAANREKVRAYLDQFVVPKVAAK